MRLEKVTGRPFLIVCAGCEKTRYAGDVESPGARYVDQRAVCADLDGEPFKAYYCAECSDRIRELEQIRQQEGAKYTTCPTVNGLDLTLWEAMTRPKFKRV